MFAISLCLLMVLATIAAPAHAQDEGDAKTAYAVYCARCHGETGQGNGPDGASLSVKPRDFTDCKKMATITDDTMFKVIEGGGAVAGLSGEMPAWGAGLSDKEIHALVKYIRGFCKK
jgi:cytochrome c oxidase cbb3-type subunit III